MINLWQCRVVKILKNEIKSESISYENSLTSIPGAGKPDPGSLDVLEILDCSIIPKKIKIKY